MDQSLHKATVDTFNRYKFYDTLALYVMFHALIILQGFTPVETVASVLEEWFILRGSIA